MHWLLLLVCIVLEVVATSLLKLSDGFTKLLWAGLSLAVFGLIFYLLSIVFRTVPVGVTYVVWSGLGIVLISAVSYFAFRAETRRLGAAGYCADYRRRAGDPFVFPHCRTLRTPPVFYT